MSRVRVSVLPQAGGGTRYVALSAGDAALVAADPAMIEGIGALAILDVLADGEEDWVLRRTRAGVAAIRAEALGGAAD